MKRLLVFLYTEILGKKIYDEFNDVLGELKDIYVTTEEGYPRVIGYKVKREGVTFHYEFKNINFYEDKSKVKIKTTGSREILPRTYSYLLSEHLLDRKIVDINGKKVVRVNDLRIAEIAGEYRVVAVETGPAAMFRRMGTPKLGKLIYKTFRKEYEDRVLMWDDVESVEMVNNNLQLSVPYKKLSTLHPADLADILEELDDKSRKQVFESLDEDLAADTFEEIEDEYRGSIIKDLSVTKTAELLENMDNDEIVDLLDDLEEEERDKVLFNLEKEDAEEVEELLKYEDETVGSMMSKDFISFGLNLTVEETIDILKEMQPDEDVMYYIYVTDEEDKIEGLVILRDLILSKGTVKLKDIMEDNITTVRHDEPIAEVIEQAAKYDLLLTPVVDDEGRIIGVIQLHDIVDEVLYPLWKKKNRKTNNN
ncbi:MULTISPECIES: CBS domain-containing protein [Clostridium]|uniref:CBS domain-containing protein n=1 Tax=Clostridium cibarium TaxID=2762247 RepID=A0ABR8PQ92_9CLOT|nr:MULTISPECIES: CBS domain-containing protein [Clostridium]MBD7910328.1 CBS domain-containing protein [Clostridium cibarium]